MKVRKQKGQKRKLEFKDYKNCLEPAQIKTKINFIKKIDVDSLKEDLKDFKVNNKPILKTQQRFKSERHNVFTEGINKTASSSNDDKRM